MLLLLKYDDGLKTVKSSANCDAHSAESIFQTRSDICNIFYSRGMYEFPAKSGGKVMRRENEKLIIDGNAFYEIDLECVKKKKQCAQTVHPEKKTDRINSRNMKDKDNIRQHE